MAKLKRPSPSARTALWNPLSGLSRVTWARARRAPLRSSTMPCSEVLPSCPRAGSSSTSASAANHTTRQMIELQQLRGLAQSMVEHPASTTIFRRRTIGVCDDGHRNCVSRGYEGSWVGNFDMYFRNGTVPKWEEMPSRVMGPPSLFAPANQGGIQKLHSSSRPEPPLRRRSGGTRISPALFGAYFGNARLTLARQVHPHPSIQASGDIYHIVVPSALQLSPNTAPAH